VRFWGEEVYANPDAECVAKTTLEERAHVINAYTENFPRLAAAGPAAAKAARKFLNSAYVPLLNAAWGTTASQDYGHNDISLANFKGHVSTEIYAVRLWSEHHFYPGDRIGFAWVPTMGDKTPLEWLPQVQSLATHMARSLRDAYKEGGSPSDACSPNG